MAHNPISITRMGPMGVTGGLILIAIIFLSVFAPMWNQHSHKKPSGAPLESPSANHILGTDDLGIDLWAQICHGARISLLVGVGSAAVVGVFGGLLGILSGYYGGIIDKIIVGMSDGLMIIPRLPMMIVFAAFVGPSLGNIVGIIALLSWPGTARTVRAQVLSAKSNGYIKAARAYGAGFWHLTYRHFLPQSLALIFAGMIRVMGHAVVAEASMSFLGLGDPLSKSWGAIINRAISFPGIYFTKYWTWWLLSPLLCLMITIGAVSLIGRALERDIATKNRTKYP